MNTPNKVQLPNDLARIKARLDMLPKEPNGDMLVSFGDKELLFTTTAPEGWCCVPYNAKEPVSRAKLIKFLDTYKLVAVCGESVQEAFLDFAAQMVWVEAAGGVVVSPNDEVVMIRRNERWDLPKGHREMGEDFALCAAREAEEETGVRVNAVGRLLATTLHSYNLYGKWELKLTAWYEMHGEAAALTPQREEGIICAQWVPRAEIEEKIKSSFPTIRKVFDAFLK